MDRNINESSHCCGGGSRLICENFGTLQNLIADSYLQANNLSKMYPHECLTELQPPYSHSLSSLRGILQGFTLYIQRNLA